MLKLEKTKSGIPEVQIENKVLINEEVIRLYQKETFVNVIHISKNDIPKLIDYLLELQGISK